MRAGGTMGDAGWGARRPHSWLRASALLLLLLLPAACAAPDEAAPQPTGGLQRAVVVDVPSAARSPTAPPQAASVAPTAGRPDPLAEAELFATATADALGALAEAAASAPGEPTAAGASSAPAPAAAGLVLALEPLPCGALTLDSVEPPRDCAEELLQSGRLEGRELMALLGFDLGALPPGAELLYAGLELVTADDRFARPGGAWRVEAIALPKPSFSQVLAARPLSSQLAWRVEAAELAAGRRLTLELGEEARNFLASWLAEGQTRLGFRILGAGRDGGLVSWQARGQSGPRLRLAYLDPRGADRAPEGLVDWQAPGAAPTPPPGAGRP